MRGASAQLITFLANWNSSTVCRMADLYTFTLVTGEVFRFSGFQTQINAPLPETTTPLYTFIKGPRFRRTGVKIQTGIQVDELRIEMFVGEQDKIGFSGGGTLTWQLGFQQGLFDGAYVELLRAYLSYSPPFYIQPTMEGTITWFYGRVGDIEIGRTSSKIIVKSLLDLLTVQMPRRLFQSSCNHVFGEPGFGMCGYDRVNGRNALGTSTGIGAEDITCQAGSDQNLTTTTFIPSPATAYNNGTILGLSGLNQGFTRTIGFIDVAASPRRVFYLKPWVFPVIAGSDTFRLLPGCDHTLATCTGTFENQARYGGFPYIPPPEVAV